MNVGDYVRTKFGNIYKIDEIGNHIYAEDNTIIQGIIKSSPNIIDLIEVGDYVDKLRVVDKDENYIVVETFDERIVITKEDTIKSIVTKEMYSSVEYRVESH